VFNAAKDLTLFLICGVGLLPWAAMFVIGFYVGKDRGRKEALAWMKKQEQKDD
jgi:hypothetical protein